MPTGWMYALSLSGGPDSNPAGLAGLTETPMSYTVIDIDPAIYAALRPHAAILADHGPEGMEELLDLTGLALRARVLQPTEAAREQHVLQVEAEIDMARATNDELRRLVGNLEQQRDAGPLGELKRAVLIWRSNAAATDAEIAYERVLAQIAVLER